MCPVKEREKREEKEGVVCVRNEVSLSRGECGACACVCDSNWRDAYICMDGCVCVSVCVIASPSEPRR